MGQISKLSLKLINFQMIVLSYQMIFVRISAKNGSQITTVADWQ